MENFYSQRFKRVNVAKARRLFNEGKTVYMCANKCAFDSQYFGACAFNKDSCSFDNVCNEFRYYNCDRERGKHIRFFVDENNV